MSQPQTQTSQTARTGMKPSSVLYWMRASFGVIAALTNYSLGVNDKNFGELAMPLAIGIALVFYLFSVMIVRHLLHYSEVDLKGKNKYITLGGGTFIVIWLMVSVLLNTVA